ncbi:metallophosphoesterase [Chitinophaga sp. Hz27]|uniref:metallophosphoesterase n=1 Tax=Chitinophaga sp. Hz27 TaxID=3347169 RepID=UPI0035DB3157
MPTRTFVIGDIHGALLALKQLLLSLSLQPSDTLIFLGDYVDGWPHNAETISYLIQLSQKQSCIFIRGNHDVYCEQWLRTGKADPNWLQNRGTSTLQSYQNVSLDTRTQHLHFFEDLNNFYIDDQQRLFLHAGYVAEQGPEQDEEFNLYWDRTLWEQTIEAYRKNERNGPARLQLFREIFIGHSSTKDYGSEKPMNAYNLWNIDSGAGHGLSLSALQLETHTIYQSHHVRWLYHETGKAGPAKVVFSIGNYMNRK